MKTYNVHFHQRTYTVEADSYRLTSAGPDDPHVYEFNRNGETVATFEFHGCLGVQLVKTQDS